MKLIVDSGSTKSDWVLLDGKERRSFQTRGFNPVFHDSRFIEVEIRKNIELTQTNQLVSELHFYGAGCSSDARNVIVKKALSSIFPKADIRIDHDLTACALATYNGVPAISCILGTGSNACYYDGKVIAQAVPSLGFILGDEGGGAYFGKQLVTDFLYKRLPQKLYTAFEEEKKINKEEVIFNVYKSPNPNVYLASFMDFALAYSDEEYIRAMIFNGFRKFNEIHVCAYSFYREIQTHYIGSIAYLFKNELLKSCVEFEINAGNIIQKPIEGLIHYHESI